MRQRFPSVAGWALFLANIGLLVAVLGFGKGGMWQAIWSLVIAVGWGSILWERRKNRQQAGA